MTKVYYFISFIYHDDIEVLHIYISIPFISIWNKAQTLFRIQMIDMVCNIWFAWFGCPFDKSVQHNGFTRQLYFHKFSYFYFYILQHYTNSINIWWPTFLTHTHTAEIIKNASPNCSKLSFIDFTVERIKNILLLFQDNTCKMWQ